LVEEDTHTIEGMQHRSRGAIYGKRYLLWTIIDNAYCMYFNLNISIIEVTLFR
jgi:hypothetical protein